MSTLVFKLADQPWEFEAIHALNYRTFVEEIPQHHSNTEKRLVDRFHAENTYAICLDGNTLVGMVAGRGQRPFSLDQKLDHLDSYLPPHRAAVEVRLLSVAPEYRKTAVFVRMITKLAEHFRPQGYDLALISGTVRQTKLYRHLGFQPFGPLVGTSDAAYQPMYLTLDAFAHLAPILGLETYEGPRAVFLPGPVTVSEAVSKAFQAPAVSHRGAAFVEMHAETRNHLCALTSSRDAVLLLGSGTLANESIAAQLSHHAGPGLILVNGEFGERLVDHAKRWRLEHQVLQFPWGASIDLEQVAQTLKAHQHIRWLWMALCETSTGIMNPLKEIETLCRDRNIALCLDAISAIGTQPLDLGQVALASCVSGKALGAFPGIAIVLANISWAGAGQLPRYLDLAAYAAAEGIPYTQSSNLVSALHTALASTDWPSKFKRIAAASQMLRQKLRETGFNIVARESDAAPAVISLALTPEINSVALGQGMRQQGYDLSFESGYLRARNWLQICLMGEWQEQALQALPEVLALEKKKLLV